MLLLIPIKHMRALPDFNQAALATAELLSSDELAECHGMLCGLLCGGAATGLGDYLASLQACQLIESADAELQQLFSELIATSQAQLADEHLGFELWLPLDHEPLQDRARALGSWCAGYLTGLTESCGAQLEQASADVREVVSDMSAISQVSLDEGQDPESEENAFMEILEFVRVAVLLVQEELSGPGLRDRIH